jgi:hypothetical protein
MVVGDLIIVTNPESTGFEKGDVGLLVKIEEINKEIKIYWLLLGNYNGYAPFWEGEIELLNEKI